MALGALLRRRRPPPTPSTSSTCCTSPPPIASPRSSSGGGGSAAQQQELDQEKVLTVFSGMSKESEKLLKTQAAAGAGTERSNGSRRGRIQPPPHLPSWSAAAAAAAAAEEEALVARLRGLAVGTDRWTALLAALWVLLFLALVVNKQELWVVLAGLVAYACFCFMLDVVAIPPYWNGPLKANQTARLSNGLVCIAHSLAMGLAALFGASAILKLTMTCGFLLFDLWDKTWKRLYTSPPYRYTRGIPYALQGATTLVLSITAICKGIPLNADLLVVLPAVHLLYESSHDLVGLFALECPGILTTAQIFEMVLILPARLLPHAALLASHLLITYSSTPSSLNPSLPPSSPAGELLASWWATRVMTTLLLMLNASNVASLFWPAFLRAWILAHHQQQQQKQQQQQQQQQQPQQETLSSDSSSSITTNPSSVPPSLLWYVHGKAYNLEAFLSLHPGGAHALSLGQGRDCTALFESYHPFTQKHKLVLGKYWVEVEEEVLDEYCVAKKEGGKGRGGKRKEGGKEEGEEMEEEDVFYNVLKERVKAVMKGVDVVASWKRRSYYCLTLLVVLLSYRGFLSGSYPALLIFSLFSWLLGAMGHDGSHFACSHLPWVNRLCGLGISLIASPFLWYHQHTFAHHSFTNDFDHDPDLHHFVLTRPHAKQAKIEKLHFWQQFRLYVLLQYSLVAFGECVWIPLKLLCFRTLHGVMSFPNLGWKGVGRAMVHFVLYVLLVFWVPGCRLGREGGRKWWLFPVVYVSICGMLFGVFSQINHLNEKSIASARGEAAKEEGKERGRQGEGGTRPVSKMGGRSWAKEQVETSSNFATHSWVWFVLSNGLNYQIEHHLFPGINHEHLWRVQPVVKEACEEFGVNYKSYQSMSEIAWETAKYYRSLA